MFFPKLIFNDVYELSMFNSITIALMAESIVVKMMICIHRNAPKRIWKAYCILLKRSIVLLDAICTQLLVCALWTNYRWLKKHHKEFSSILRSYFGVMTVTKVQNTKLQ